MGNEIIEFSEGFKALPDNIEIKDSSIHGQGLFAKEDIPSNTDVGESHLFLMQDWDGETWGRKEWMRTALGAFLNHSEDPNCTVSLDYAVGKLITTKSISAGTELTITYTSEAMEAFGGY